VSSAPSLALIDYKAGNLTSVRKALTAIGASVFTPDTPHDLADAQGIIVPGVGHFGATRVLDGAWIDAILDRVGNGRPLLGICLGMQWLFEGSDEAPDLPGLGLLGGRCYRLGGAATRSEETPATPGRGIAAPGTIRIKIPHVGWNRLERRREGSIAEGIADGAQVYFTHSFVAPVTSETIAATEHGEAFASIVQRGQVAGVQFHPEKSGDVGLRILRNFVASAT
jgi:glutamine amidotransferase